MFLENYSQGKCLSSIEELDTFADWIKDAANMNLKSPELKKNPRKN